MTKVNTKDLFDIYRSGRLHASNVKFLPNGKDYKIGDKGYKFNTLGPNDTVEPAGKTNESLKEDNNQWLSTFEDMLGFKTHMSPKWIIGKYGHLNPKKAASKFIEDTTATQIDHDEETFRRETSESVKEETDNEKLERYKKYTYVLDGKKVIPDNIDYFNNYLGVELDGKYYRIGSPNEDGIVQIKPRVGKTGIYTELKKGLKEDHTLDPNDRYMVKFSKENNTYQVWEGDELISDFATKERAEAEAKRLNILDYIKKLDSDQHTDRQVKDYEDNKDNIHALPGASIYYNESKVNVKHLLKELKLSPKLISSIDSVNPLEYNTGIDYELDILGDFSAEGLEKAAKKAVNNLTKDPIYYTNLKANLTQKINKKQVEATKQVEVKKDNHTDQLNKLKTLVKKEMANTKTTLSKKEKASKATPKGVKLMKENEDLKAKQKKDFQKFSDKMKTQVQGGEPTKKNTFKKIKEYLVRSLKKEAIGFTVGGKEQYVSNAEAPAFEQNLKKTGVKFTKRDVK